LTDCVFQPVQQNIDDILVERVILGISLVSKMERLGIASVVEEGITKKQEGFSYKVSIGHLIFGLCTVGVAVTLAWKLELRKNHGALRMW
jgi:hypothetical protein